MGKISGGLFNGKCKRKLTEKGKILFEKGYRKKKMMMMIL